MIDTHKALFGYRLDTVAAAADPEGLGALMLDTLHPTSLGAIRVAEVIEKTLNPHAPYTGALINLGANTDVSPIFMSAHWTKTVRVYEAGTNYLRIYRNPLSKLVNLQGFKDPRVNQPTVEAAMYYSQLADAQEIKRLGSFYIYFHNTGNTFGPLTFTSFIDRPANSDFQINPTGAFGGNTGPATIYVLAQDAMPNMSLTTLPINIELNGPQPLTIGARGAQLLTGGRGTFRISDVSGFRESNSGTAVIGLYLGNQVAGTYVGSLGSFGYPGAKLGDLSFGAGFRNSAFGADWVADVTNFPSGIIDLNWAATQEIIAVVSAGTIGVCGSVKITLTTP